MLAFLDVDGDGVNSISGADVFGWYDGQATAALIPSSQSQTGLDFALPLAEIHGTLTRVSEQIEARPDFTVDPTCMERGFRPRPDDVSSGPYAIIGLYPGTYCVSASGLSPSGSLRVCFGDPSCVNPTLVSLGETEIRTGIDLDFTATVPVLKMTWGVLKSRYP